jgi:hypothetical protein
MSVLAVAMLADMATAAVGVQRHTDLVGAVDMDMDMVAVGEVIGLALVTMAIPLQPTMHLR